MDTSKIIKSFKIQDTLNPKVWDKDGSSYKLKPTVRESLLKIANEFIDFVDFDIFFDDIIMTGSLAGYNWSNYSDIDLHIIVNFEQFPKEQHELFEELFSLKKIVFNDKHNIKVKGFDVELYIQNSEEPHESQNTYSILYDEWIDQSKKEDFTVNKTEITKKAQEWMELIDTVIDMSEEEDLAQAKEILKKYKEKIKNYRQAGLEKNGEFSNENLVFKVLRRSGYIDKLYNFQDKLIDKKLSLGELKRNQ